MVFDLVCLLPVQCPCPSVDACDDDDDVCGETLAVLVDACAVIGSP